MEVSVKSALKRNLLPDSNRAVLRPPGTRSRSGSFSFFLHNAFLRTSDLFRRFVTKLLLGSGQLLDQLPGVAVCGAAQITRRYRLPLPTIRQHFSHPPVAQSFRSIH